jgi:hypothetical protein
MAIEVTASQIAHDGDGITTIFHTNFPILDGVDVWEEDLASGILTRLDDGTHYTWAALTVNAQVMAVTAPAAGKRWHLMRATRPVQPVRLPSDGKLPTERVEKTLDRGAMTAQEMQREQARTLSAPITEAQIAALPRAVDRAGRLLTFDAQGQPAASAVTMEQIAQVIDGAYVGTSIAAGYKWVGNGVAKDFDLPDEWAHMTASTSLLLAADTLFIDFDTYTLGGGILHMLTAPPRGTVIVGRNNLSVAGAHAAEAAASATAAQDAADEARAARDQAVDAAAIAIGNASDASVVADGPVPIPLRERFGGGGLNILEFHYGPGPDITAALNLAAEHARENFIRGLFVPAGSWQVSGSINLTFAAAGGEFGGPGRLNLVGAGATTTWIYVRLTEAFPAFDLTGNTQALVRGLCIQHAADCASTRTFLFAKPVDGGSEGSEAQIVDVQVQRQSNEPVARPCITIANTDLPTLTRCQLFGRVGLEVGIVPAGVASKFQAISAMTDFTLGSLDHVNIQTSDAAILFYGGPAVLLNIWGGYMAAHGTTVPAMGPGGGAKAIVHVMGAGARVNVHGLRFENQTSPTVALDAMVAFHANSGQSVIEIAGDADDPLFWIAAGATVAALECTAFCSYTGPAVIKSAGGGLIDSWINTNRATLLSGSLATNLRNAQQGYVWTAPAGNQQAPGLQIGSGAMGFYPSSRADALAGASVLGLTLDGFEMSFFRVSATALGFGAGAPPTDNSNGLATHIFGGRAGAISGNGGPAFVRASLPSNGAGATAGVIGSAGVGINMPGGGGNLFAGAATGTATGGAVNIGSGASPAGASGDINIIVAAANGPGVYAGTLTQRAGDSAAGYPGSHYIDSGIGTANPGVAVVALRNRALGPIQFQVGGANRWSIDGNGSYAFHLRPEVPGALDLGVADIRIRDVYLTNSPNVSSDERKKLDIQPISNEDAAAFLDLLQPSMYRLADAGRRTTGYAEAVEEVEETDPLTGEKSIRTVPVLVPIEEQRTGVRWHAGLIAQNVRAGLTTVFPTRDLALWGLENASDPDSMQHLRYEQFVPMLIGAVKFLAARVEALETSLGEAP